jgi:hypothetical protein
MIHISETRTKPIVNPVLSMVAECCFRMDFKINRMDGILPHDHGFVDLYYN